MKTVSSHKFDTSDWIVVTVLSLLLLAGLVTGAVFGVKAYLRRLAEQQTEAAAAQKVDLLAGDLDHGGDILDLYARKKSGVVLFFDDQCLAGAECAGYLSDVLTLQGLLKEGAPVPFYYNPDVAQREGDTNVKVALARAGATVLPTLLVVRDGVEAGRVEGFAGVKERLIDLFLSNNLLDNAALQSLLDESKNIEE